MALNIKNPEVEKLATEVAELAGESKTTAILQALRERKVRLLPRRTRVRRVDEMRDFLEREVWSLPDVDIGQVSEDEPLGYGPAGA